MPKKSCQLKFGLELNDLQELDLKWLTPERNPISLQKYDDLKFKANAACNIDLNLI